MRPSSGQRLLLRPRLAVGLRPTPALPRRNAPTRTDSAAAPTQVARLGATDPRWVLALQATASLRGGRAAILSPDRRRSLETFAKRLGLRPFDAALVLAIVQDAGRRGESVAERGPVMAARLTLVRPADVRPEPGASWCLAMVTLLLSGAFFAAAWIALN